MEALREGGLTEVTADRIAAPMPTRALEEWWERVPQLTGPLALVLPTLAPDVRDAIRQRALDYGRAAARQTPDGLEFGGSVLVGSGRRG